MGGWSFDESEPSPQELRESENLLRQYDLLNTLIRGSLRRRSRRLLWPGLLRRLHCVAARGFEAWSPGEWRITDVHIPYCLEPPHWTEVRALVDSLCEYVNGRLTADPDRDDEVDEALFLGAYTLWRVNWIHPFNDGNGRTARAAAYFVTSLVLELELPGKLAIHEFIRDGHYYEYIDGLDAADKAAEEGRIDVFALQDLLSRALTAQLRSR